MKMQLLESTVQALRNGTSIHPLYRKQSINPTQSRRRPSALHVYASTQPVGIRQATDADLDSIQLIEDSSRPGGNWNRAQILEELQRDRSIALVSSLNNNTTPTGWLVAWRVVDELQILQVAVSPDHQRQGIATVLLTCLLKDYKEDATSAVLEVRAGNEAAIRLYEKLGFTTVGKRPKYYSDGEDALLMHLTL